MTRTIAPRLRILVLLLIAVTGALLAGAGPASAHAALTGSDPAQGVVADKAPTQVSLTFSEKVALNDGSLRVLDPRGTPVQTGSPANVSGTTYAVKLKSGLAKGTYTVTYQVVSADSHPVAGAYTFSVGAPSETVVSGAGPAAGGGVVGGLYAFGRYMSYAGFTVLAGGAAFVLACWRRGAGVRPLQRLVVGGWVTLTAATLWLLLLRGSYTGSGKFADVFDLDLLGQVLQTKTGAALVSRLLLLAAAALFVAVLFGAYTRREEGPEKRDLTFGLAVGGVVVAAGLASSWAMAEHASTGLQPGLAMPVDVLHLLAVAAWLGGLTALLTALYRAPAETPVEAAAVRRFSRLAFGSVLVLVATGVYQSWRQLGSWSAFTETRYGQLLLVKIALVAVLVAVAAVSRRWTGRLTDPVARAGKARKTQAQARKEQVQARKEQVAAASAAGGGKGTGADDSERAAQLARQRAAVDAAREKRLRDADPNRFGLRRSVLAEAGVALVLLAVTTALTQTEPGRTELEARAAGSASAGSGTAAASGALTLDMPFDTGGTDGKGVVSIDLDPARVGANEMHVYVQRPNGRAFDVPEVKVAFTLEAKKIGPLPVNPDHITTGHWSANGVQLPMAGDWKVAVTVRTSDIDQVTVSKNAQIG
ncbi:MULTISPECIES: copper resistance CopC/CopD family protein [Streptomyces]|uniref:Copper resistance protein CopC n=2 Tax=Streptomyces TaxID=1883 RepID=A0ABS9JC16_9ACTN|nr:MULTISPECIES: copper resistance protein CopC [Streptomyces]MCG0063091.1 copper resistance protein CopC [Streptomyces tricolor]BCM68144.1 putative copper resistance protein, secreted [Streptomyces sp. EAS-AB2608]CUW29016.1 Copper transport protein YcnJ precursor [Streptomyces reticuli]